MHRTPSQPTIPLARRSRLVLYATLAYTALIAYASLYPLQGWRDPGESAFAFLLVPWPRYYTVFDVAANVLGYLPFGFLVALVVRARWPRLPAVIVTACVGVAFSVSLEAAQSYLPMRVASSADLLSNGLGALVGSILAVAIGDRWLLSGRLYRLRSRWFLPGGAVDFGFLLLLLWLVTQLNPELWLFGTGNLSYLFRDLAATQYSARYAYLWIEAGVTASNLAAVCLLTAALARPGHSVALPLVALVGGALIVKTLAAATLFQHGDAKLWLTPGSLLGIPLGIALFGLLSRWGRWITGIACAALLVAGVVLINLAPRNPYILASVQLWQHGHLPSFASAGRLISSLWPLGTLGYLAYLARFHFLSDPPAQTDESLG